jgi:phosphoesterase RecJ-like protein
MRLLGFCLKERLVVNKELGTAYIYLSKDDLAKYDYQVGDTEGVVNYALAISGINFAVLFTEKENIVRLSLRSKGNFKVNEFANKHFKGGGHANAAGADSELSFSETLQYFESLLPAYKQQLTCICE